jgi:hypothetical protein
MREWRVLQVNERLRKGQPPLALSMQDEDAARSRQDELDRTGLGEKVIAIESREVGPWEREVTVDG